MIGLRRVDFIVASRCNLEIDFRNLFMLRFNSFCLKHLVSFFSFYRICAVTSRIRISFGVFLLRFLLHLDVIAMFIVILLCADVVITLL